MTDSKWFLSTRKNNLYGPKVSSNRLAKMRKQELQDDYEIKELINKSFTAGRDVYKVFRKADIEKFVKKYGSFDGIKSCFPLDPKKVFPVVSKIMQEEDIRCGIAMNENKIVYFDLSYEEINNAEKVVVPKEV